MTGRYLEENTPKLLEAWFGPEAGENKLGLAEETVDGMSKWDLLAIAVPTHDYGKFTRRQFKEEDEDGPRFSFKGHEAESGAIVREWSGRFKQLANGRGLTDSQIEYVAQCAALHFELAKLRDAAKDTEYGYTIAFTQTDDFRERAQTIINETPDMAREIGVFFIADSLGKTDLHHTVAVESDAEAEGMRGDIEAEIKQRGISHHLTETVVQMGVNMAASKGYLAIVREILFTN